MDNIENVFWRIIYYPIPLNNKTKEVYSEPRALIDRKIEGGWDLREVPLRYLKKVNEQARLNAGLRGAK